MSTIVRNEADLDTLLDENLVTEDYALEILGLKNIADFRKFSRSFMKLSKIVKGIDDSNNEKLDKGLLPSTLSTAEKIVSALQSNGGLKFDPDLLYLNDEGTKKVGYYYLDRLKNGIFECLVETTTTVNDSSKFRDISNKASADRLDNLQSYIIQKEIEFFDNGNRVLLGYICKIGNAVFFSGTFIAKNNHIYGTIDSEFRPTNEVYLRSNVATTSTTIGTAAIVLNTNGLLKTTASYPDTLVPSFSSMWFSNT